MTGFTCTRCKESTQPMPAPPFPGGLAKVVHENICAPCWKAWLQAQVNLINEHRFVMTNPEHRAHLNGQMKEFLSLPES